MREEFEKLITTQITLILLIIVIYTGTGSLITGIISFIAGWNLSIPELLLIGYLEFFALLLLKSFILRNELEELIDSKVEKIQADD
ncbi:hypothetical protein H1S01_18840 [Heliobacterium chlorum]|uniref:DUF4282 domain-containing protein n=1 Tax=Heliobacterium chlorum TaxID=2698 RepID=A0ABR7T6X9_HELCL|nr:hypothetical protein [Heliobacterium chlorum]MBC9786515.1 hypothetical protein [Heliobacterium chlorum]